MVLKFLAVFCHSGYFWAIFDHLWYLLKKRGGRGRFFDGVPLTIFTIESNIDTEEIDAESGFFACFQITSLFLWSEVK